MSTFTFSTLTNNPDSAQYESACLGVDADNKFTEQDKGKPVKVATGSSFVLCANGDEIEGIFVALEPVTYNSGFSFGTVQRRGRVEAEVGAGEVGTVAVGTAVVADAQDALGTAGPLKVKGGAPATFIWRCIAVLTGTGATGDTVLLERV